jgi:hypothetical protein
MTYHVEEFVAVKCNAVCEFDAVGSLLEQLIVRFVAEGPSKHSHSCTRQFIE